MASFKIIIGSAKHENIDSLLDSFHNAAKTGNLVEYFGCFHNEESKFIGTDSKENWSCMEFYEETKQLFNRPGHPAWVFTPQKDKRQYKIYTSSDNKPLFATFDELLDSESFGATSRGTGTLIFSIKYWYIASYHLSFPIPDDIAKTVSYTHIKAILTIL